jgi:GTPase SAR1 family protein
MDFYFFKTICVGDTGVGKTHFMETIRQRLRPNGNNIGRLSPIHETIGVQFYSKMFAIDDNKRVKIHFWDLSGQRRFREIIESYYTYGDAILLCFDVSNYHSFLSCHEWINELKSALKDESFRPFIFLLGLRRKQYRRVVTKSMIQEFVTRYHTTYIEFNNTISSAYQICDTVIRTLIRNIEYIANHRNRFVMNIDDDEFTSTENKVIITNDSFSILHDLRLSYSSNSRSICAIDDENPIKKGNDICCFSHLC